MAQITDISEKLRRPGREPEAGEAEADAPTILWEIQFPRKDTQESSIQSRFAMESRVHQSTRKDFKVSHRGDLERGTQGLMVNALVPTGEEGRSKLRKASESCKRAKTRGYPNGVT